MFKVTIEKCNDLNCIKIFNLNTGEFVSVVPEFGANVNDLLLAQDGQLIAVIDGSTTRLDFRTHTANWYRPCRESFA